MKFSLEFTLIDMDLKSFVLASLTDPIKSQGMSLRIMKQTPLNFDKMSLINTNLKLFYTFKF
jgi:hypothetical protein